MAPRMTHEMVDPILFHRDLTEFGFTRRNADKLIRSGEWRRLRHGAIQIGERLLRPEDQHRLLVKATVRQWRSRAPMAISHARRRCCGAFPSGGSISAGCT